MDDHLAPPTRRGVLAVLGAGLLLPVTVRLLWPDEPEAEADGLRVEVLGASRAPRPGHTEHPQHAEVPASRWETPPWPDVVRVDLRVRNVSPGALLVSAGQFRLVAHGLGVMPTAWQHDPAALAPGAVRTGWVDYRAPRTGGPLRLDFTPAGRPAPVALPLHRVPGPRS